MKDMKYFCHNPLGILFCQYIDYSYVCIMKEDKTETEGSRFPPLAPQAHFWSDFAQIDAASPAGVKPSIC